MQGNNLFVDLTSLPINIESALGFLTNYNCGAHSIFLGTARNNNHGRIVEALEYDAHVELAKNVLTNICIEAAAGLGTHYKIATIHRTGKLNIGEVSVFIGVSTPHRSEAFEACRYIIEKLKHRAPIWKKEYYSDGTSEWSEGCSLCGNG
ncbi:MAG: molybdenum cofactor biosynthesis protein MoaE [Deltaproteobacteria bacterium]|nr:molybdenum cofactor biosynthesis protein MoaE [Deltaproteobacteria bacterium]